MLKVQLVAVACFAVVVAGPPIYPKNPDNVDSKAVEASDLVGSEAEYLSDTEQVQNILKYVLDASQAPADSSLNGALTEAEDVEIVKEDQFGLNTDIIAKIKKCLKQIIERNKDKAEAISEDSKRIINDILKMKDCKGSKEEIVECIKKNVALIKEDISHLIDDSSKQIQWLIKDVLPDLYHCVRAE